MYSTLKLYTVYEQHRAYDAVRDSELLNDDYLVITTSYNEIYDQSSFFVIFKSDRIDFYIMQKGFELDDEPIQEFEIKLNKIADKARDYIRICSDPSGSNYKSFDVYNDTRIAIHDMLAKEIDDVLTENGVSQNTEMDPTTLARNMITVWFRQLAYIEKTTKTNLNPRIGSFLVFYDELNMRRFMPGP